MIYKLDESKRSHAFINDMLTTKPMSNVKVAYYSYTKELIASGYTDSSGMLDLKLKEKPFLMVAQHEKQRAYMKLGDGYTNSLSKFDIQGQQVQKGVKGFIYAERGVWRPGDSLYLNFMLENKDKSLPENHPISFELFSPEGQLIESRTTSKNTNGVFDLRTSLSAESPTGNYTAVVQVGNNRFSKNLKIETVKPNRLKIYLDMEQTNLKDSFVLLQSKWLHGAVAKNLKANVRVSVKHKNTSFKGYQNYSFDSPLRYFVSNEELVFDGMLDEAGKAKVRTKINVSQDSPGMLTAIYTTKVYEKGGAFSIDRCSRTYSPYQNYVGIELPKSNSFDNSLETGKSHTIQIVSLDEQGKLKKDNRLLVKVYRLNWQWWYESQENQGANFISANGAFVIKDTVLTNTSGKSVYFFKADKQDYGRFLITVTDLEGNHQAGKIFTVDWPYYQRGNRGGNEHANLLNFTSDKESYETGEKIKLSIPSPANGSALISVETRSKVLKKYWIKTTKGETLHELVATKDMAPNAFIHVTLLQPHASTQNDLPIRLYGIVPVLVEDPKTHLHPKILMKDEVRPNSKVSLKVSETSGRSMTYTLAIVDEGLLDLTRFQTPNPWSTFYAKEALGIKTWDMYEDVIGAYAGKLNKLLSIGGDEGLNAGKGNKANRFKPMVKYLGVFHINANQTKTHTVDIPNYIGSVKVMLVARNEASYGQADKQVLVNKPLMLIPTLPRVVGPTEEITLPVNVFAMKEWVKDVTISLESNDFFEIIGSKTQSLHFDKPGDEVLNFKLKVASKTGIARIKIKAVSGKETAYEEIEIDVRSPNPTVYETSNFTLEPGKKGNETILFDGVKGTNEATIEFSTIPSFGLEKRLGYLMNYPHGCIEQTTSSVFPQLFLSSLLDLSDAKKKEISQNIKAGIDRIQLFQTMNGGFSYWPNGGNASEWGTNYAGHFLITAEKRGYKISQSLKDKWLKYQKDQALNWQNSNDMYPKRTRISNEITQAYRLFVLALANKAELGAMNRLREERGISEVTKWRLAAAYELAGHHEIAVGLMKNASLKVEDYRELYGSYGSGFRDKAMLVETLSLINDKKRAKGVMDEILQGMGTDNWLSTQETAYGLLAVCAYTGNDGSTSEMKYTIQLEGQQKIQASSKKTLVQLKYSEKDIAEKGKVFFQNMGKSTLFVKIIVANQPLIGDVKRSEKGLHMEVNYFNMDHEKIDPKRLKQGTEFYAEVKLTNTSSVHYKEMALNQIFPSCWEIHNDRMGETQGIQVADYQDIRDDRVYSYYQLKPGETKFVKVKLNATFIGKCYLPTLYSDAMYDHLIYSKIPGMWVEVVF
jgi:alpha-2-macroglobulin